MAKQNYYVVREDALPKIIIKVTEAENLIKSGAVKSTSEAIRKTGISRSVFYKYRNSVVKLENNSQKTVVSISAILKDKIGMLSDFINNLYDLGANILTINQENPQNGAAVVTVTYRVNKSVSNEELLKKLKTCKGVIAVNKVEEN